MKFKDLLIDVLSAVERFRGVVSYVILKDKGDHAIIKVKSTDGSIAIEGRTKEAVDGFDHTACLGSLDFLKASLTTNMMKNGNIETNFDLSSNGKMTVLHSLTLTGEHGYTVFYQAVDPFVANLSNIQTPKNIEWAALFPIDTVFQDRFSEIVRIHQKSPKIGTDEDDIYELSYENKEISAGFGEKGHQASIILTQEAESTGSTNIVSAFFSISTTDAILKFTGKETAVGYLHNRAMRIDIQTKYVEYEFTSTAKLKRK